MQPHLTVTELRDQRLSYQASIQRLGPDSGLVPPAYRERADETIRNLVHQMERIDVLLGLVKCGTEATWADFRLMRVAVAGDVEPDTSDPDSTAPAEKIAASPSVEQPFFPTAAAL